MRRWLKRLFEHAITYANLVFLGLISLCWSLLALPAWALLPRRQATAFGRAGIMRGFRLYAALLRLSGAYRLDLRALDALRDGPPLILVPNHPSLIDAPMILTCHPNIACVLKPQLMKNVFLGPGARLARYIRSGQTRQMIKDAVRELQNGGIVLLFPEGTRSTRMPVNALTGSVGVIARHAHVPVQVALIETDSPYLSKGWPVFRVPSVPITYRVRLGRRFDPPEDVGAFMAELEREFATELASAPQAAWLGADASSQPKQQGYCATPAEGGGMSTGE